MVDDFWTEHRPATSDEHGIEGRIHGYCRRCIRPWPCEYAPEQAHERAYAAMREALELVQAHGSLTREARVTVDAALALAAAADSPTTEAEA